MSILFAILLFSLLIFVHELGHFLTAKASGVQVNEFALFMGPAIFKKQVGETLYSIRCIPFGGYCAMEGEDDDSDNPRSFGKASWWKRIIILAAGAFMNLVAGALLITIVYAPAEQFVVPVIDYVEPSSALGEGNGLQAGDRILKVDGENIYVQSDFEMILTINGGETHDFLVERNGEKVELTGVSTQRREFANEDGTTTLRYGITFTLVEASFGETAGYIWNTCVDTVRTVRLSLQMLFTGRAGYIRRAAAWCRPWQGTR